MTEYRERPRPAAELSRAVDALPATGAGRRTQDRAGRRARLRWLVHLGLIVTVVISLIFEPIVLTIHIVIGLGFGLLVAAHLIQRRHVSANLAARLLRITGLARPADRLALADTLLTALTVAMLVSGFWDWFAGHPTRIRWHALTGVALTVVLVVHTVRRRSRLRRSKVR
jgi:hypothetical protein